MRYRKLGAVVGFGFLTLGIYSACWLYSTRKDVVATTGDPKSVPSFWWLLAGPIALFSLPVFSLVFSSAHPTVSGVKTGTHIALVILGIAAGLACVVIPIWWDWKFSNAVAKITQGNSAALLFWMGIFLYACSLIPIWSLIIQEDINKMLANGQAQSSKPPQPPAMQNGQH